VIAPFYVTTAIESQVEAAEETIMSCQPHPDTAASEHTRSTKSNKRRATNSHKANTHQNNKTTTIPPTMSGKVQ